MKPLIILLAVLFAGSALARDPAQVRAFRKQHPCPATEKHTGPCPGYVVDHIVPLCAGGADHPKNLQWQDKKTAAAKDVLEKRHCACLRAHKTTCVWTGKP